MNYPYTMSLAVLLLCGACTSEPGAGTAVSGKASLPPAPKAVETGGGVASGEAAARFASGAATYGQRCAGCHESRTGGAPRPGDQADWAPRLASGLAMLTRRSIEGFDGKRGTMPARGGSMDLGDEEVANAVFYMAERSKPAAP